MRHFLDFEKPVAELEGQIEELRRISAQGDVNISAEIKKLEEKTTKTLSQIYSKLTPWQKVQVARHPNRPRCKDYIKTMFTDFTPLAGDRLFAEDFAIIGGMGRFRGQSVVVIGQERGTDTESRLKHNFGMPRPEGYRKAQRLMKLAEQYNLPVLTLVDTPGAYPGIDAEERGQSEAIAQSIHVCLNMNVPLIATVIGEGGSGGAIALAAGDRILMLEHAVYSVISPEGCASILWRSAEHAKDAAEALKLTAQDLKKLGIIDQIVTEPLGGAHRQRDEIVKRLSQSIAQELEKIANLDPAKRREMREEKFLAMGKKGL